MKKNQSPHSVVSSRRIIACPKKLLNIVSLLFLLLFFVAIHVSAQEKTFDLMGRTDLTLKEIETKGKLYFDSAGTGGGTGYKQFQRWLYERKFHSDENGYFISPQTEWNNYLKSSSSMKAAATPLTVAANWTSLGPSNATPPAYGVHGTGRISAMAIHPANANIIYVGSPGGGLWKSINAGASWTPLTDNNPLWMNIFSIAIDPSNQNIIYAGTDNVSGVIKSTNAGATWSATGAGPKGLPNPFASSQYMKILIHPTSPNIVFAAANNGIWRSVNAGGSWTQVHTVNKEDIEFKPNDPNIMYASGNAVNSSVVRSADNGITWTTLGVLQGITNSGRTLVSVSAANPNIVYAVQASEGFSGKMFGRMYRSTDAGLSFTTTVVGNPANGTNYFGRFMDGTDVEGLAWYAMGMDVSPTNANDVYIAGIICWRSTNGATSFTALTDRTYPNNTGYNHADVHGLFWVNSTLYSITDGGIYKSTDNGDNWTDLSPGLSIRQFYGFANSQTNANVITGGAQDNASVTRQASGNWVEWGVGDGMEGLVSPTDHLHIWGTFQYGNLYRSTDGGNTYSQLNRPSPGNWVTPFAIHPTNETILYGGWTGVYKSTNSGTSWTNISGAVISNPLQDLAVAPSNPNFIYASYGNLLYVTTNDGASWLTRTAPAAISDIAVDPANPSKIWIACFSSTNRVMVSTNAGATFTNITANLPAIDARTIVIDDKTPRGLYVGMNIGVYYKAETDANWTDYSANLPMVAINELEIQKSSNKLRVATYGRSIWESPLATCPTIIVTNPVITTGAAGTAFSQTFTQAGGALPATFTTASALPTGLTLSSAGVLSGIPTQIGTFPIVVKATDANTCTGNGATYTLVISCPTVTVNAVASQIVCNNDMTIPVSFTGFVPGTVYNWTNNMPSIGLAAIGMGNIVSFVATNATNVPVTATITVTPVYTGGSVICNGTPKTFTITVNPTPNAVATPASQNKCSGATITTITLTGIVSGTTYNWTRDNTATVTGIAGSGSGNIISGTLTNITNAPVTVTFFITPTANGCPGTAINVTVIVNPTPEVTQPTNQTVCNSTATTPVNFTGSVAGTQFKWTNNNPSIGVAATGSGNIPSFTATNTTNAPITAAVTVTPSSGGFAYISNQNSNDVSVINIATNSVVATVSVGSAPAGISVSRDGSRVYVANSFSNNVSVINTATNSVVATISVGSLPVGVSVNPDGSRVYVANYNSNNVSVISTATNSVVATVTVGSNPRGISVNSNGNRVYVANVFSNSVTVINTATNSVLTTVTVGINPEGISVSPNGSWVYVANFGSNNVSVINTATNSVMANITVGSNPIGISVSPDGSRVYAANYNSNNVSVINTATNSVVATILVGSLTVGVSVSPDGSRVYVANGGSNNVSVINTATNSVVATVTVGSSPVAFGNFIIGDPVCTGTSKTFTITVNPMPNAVATPSAQTICSGNAITTIALSSNVSGTTFTWTKNNPVVTGIAASGSGDISGQLINATNAPRTVTFIITPRASGCTGTAITATVIVNPVPGVTQPGNQTVCNNSAAAAVNFAGPVSGTVFKWTNNTPSIGLVANGSGNIASFTATNTTNAPVTATVTVTASAGGSFAYISNGGTNTVSVINTATNLVVKTITVGSNPSGVSVSPDGSRVYVANAGSGNVSVINTADNTVVATVTIGSNPFGISVSPDGSRVYAANFSSSNVYVISTANSTYSVVDTIPVGFTPYGVSVSPDGSRVYVTNVYDFTVLVINTADNSVIDTIPVGLTPEGIAVSPDGSRVYVANQGSDSVSVINTADNSVVRNIPVGTNPFGILVSPDGSRVYVANHGSDNVSVINTANFLVVKTIPVGSGPYGISVSPNGSRVYVANYNSNDVFVINTATNLVIDTIPAGTNPFAFGNFTGGGVSCNGTPKTFTITVNPTPDVVATPSTQTVCSGNAITTIALSSNVSGTTFTWAKNNPAVTGIGAIGSGDISGQLINTTNAPKTVIFTITPRANGCTGTAITATVIVNPVPGVTQPANQIVCNNSSAAAINFAGAVSGTVFKWTNNTPSIGLAANGSGNIASFRATNTTNAPVTATVTVTPSAGGSFAYISNNGTNTVSVINTATNLVVKTIPVGFNPSGVSVSPDGSRVYVANAGSDDVYVINTADNSVMATVPIGPNPFGISVSPDGSRVYVANYNSNNVYVISTANSTYSVVDTIPVGTNPYGVAVSPDGSRVYVTNVNDFTVSVINTDDNSVIDTITVGFNPIGVSVSPDGSRLYVANYNSSYISVINTADNSVVQHIAVGTNPQGILVSPDGSRVYVVNHGSDNVSVINTANFLVVKTISVGAGPYGASVSPNGSQLYVTNYNSNDVFVINTATNLVVDTIPAGTNPFAFGNFTGGGVSCNGTPKTFTITVNPSPNVVATPSTQTSCSGNAITTIALSSNVSGTTFTWTKNNPTVTGIGAIGSGDISGTLTNATNAPKTVIFTITPKANGCTGPAVTVTVIVNPIPGVTQPSDRVVCNNSATGAINFSRSSGSVAVTAFNWANNTTSIGLPESGNGNIASFTATNSGTTPVIATITVTPVYTNAGVSCNGTPKTFTITVNPTPTVNAIANKRVCNGDAIAAIQFGSNATSFTWTNNTPSIGLAANGVGDIMAFTAINSGTTPVTATIRVTPVYTNTNGGVSCNGTLRTFRITVNPTPTVNAVTSQTVCRGTATAAVTFTGNATSFTWTNTVTSIGLAAFGTGNIAAFTAINNGTTPVTATITVTPVHRSGGVNCNGTPTTFTITVNPTPTVNAPAITQPTCAVSTGTIVVNATGAGTLEYSVNNGSTWQSSNTFSGLAPGIYNIRVRLQSSPACITNYGGNPIVLNTPVCPVATTVNKLPAIVQPMEKIIKPKEIITNNLRVSILPNPTESYFNLKVQSKSMEVVTIKVADIAGRQVQQMKGMPGQTFRFGDHIVNGTYLVEVRQGSERVVTKVVKQ